MVEEIINDIIILNPKIEFQNSILQVLRYNLNKNFDLIFGRIDFQIIKDLENDESVRIEESLIIQKNKNENFIQLFLAYLDKEYTIFISCDKACSILLKDDNNILVKINFTNDEIRNEIANYENNDLINVSSYAIKNLNNFDLTLDETECPNRLRKSVMFELIVRERNITNLNQLFYLKSMGSKVFYELVSSKMISTENISDYFNMPFNSYACNTTCDVAISLKDSTDSVLNHLDFVFSILENVYDKNISFRI